MRPATLFPRRVTRAVRVGSLTVGGDAPVAVQSMTKTDTRDVEATLRQIEQMEAVGCEVIRMAVPDEHIAHVVRVEPDRAQLRQEH